MSAQVISLFEYFESSRDWTQRELAEFYRVESALIQAGLLLETDRGVTDEGEPWFVFCRSDTGEAFIHFARVDGNYIAVGSALDRVVEGRDFAALVQEILAAQAWVMAKARNRSNVFLHPSALLIAIVGAAFFHSGEAKADVTSGHAHPEPRRHILPIIIGATGEKTLPALDATETAAIVSSVLIEWNRLAPSAPSGRETLLMVSAASAADLAPPPPLIHVLGPMSDTALQTIAQDSDPVAPPPGLAVQHQLGGQDPDLATLAIPVNVLTPEHVVGDSLALDSLNAPTASAILATPTVVDASVLIQSAGSDAAEVIQSVNVLGDLAFQSAPVTPTATLIGLVNRGEHVAVDPAHSAPTPSEHTPTIPPTAEISTAPAPSNGATGVVELTAAPALSAIDPQIAAAVLQFAAEVKVLDVAVSGHEIILYDGAIFQPMPAGTVLESMTFNFSDGSSISLVGTVAELQALHLT